MSQTESGVAEQMVNMSIRALESLSRLLAAGAKNLAVFLFTVAKGTKQYRGVASVKTLLDGGHELKTLELDKKELHEFCVHAKKNDFPCTIIHDKRLYQDKVPVLIRAVDAARANRVIELMRLNQPAQEREAAREAVNPTTERTASRSPSRSRSRPSAPRYTGRENTASTYRSELRPSVRGKIVAMRRERDAQRAQSTPERVAQPVPAQARAWSARDEQMMEAVRQFIATLTALTQEVTQPQTIVPPDQAKGDRAPQQQRVQTQQPRGREQQARGQEPAAPVTPAAQSRQSVGTSVAQAKQRRDASTASRAPAPSRGAPTRGGR